MRRSYTRECGVTKELAPDAWQEINTGAERLAKENNIELTEETAKAYFGQLNPPTGELSDDELDNVAGGGCNSEDRHLNTERKLRI